jgi:TonB family protein
MKPDYPEDAKQAGVNGIVELEGVVQIDGSIDRIRVTKGIDERLDREARQGARPMALQAVVRGRGC